MAIHHRDGTLAAASPDAGLARVEVLPPARRHAGRATGRARGGGAGRGARAAFVRPLGLAVAGLTILAGVAALGTPYLRGWLQLLDHRRPAHADGSTIDLGQEREVPDDAWYVAVTDADGRRHLVVAGREELDGLGRHLVVALERGRASVKERVARDLDVLFPAAFADGLGTNTEAFADWHFGVWTGYDLMARMGLSAVRHALPSGPQSVAEGVSNDLDAYVMAKFTDYVLRPEERDPRLKAGLVGTLEAAHAGYLRAAAASELSLRLFASERIAHVGPPAGAVTVSLDWSGQGWKTPPGVRDGRIARAQALYGLGTVGGAAGGAGLGLLAPPAAVQAGVKTAVGRTLARVTAAVGRRGAMLAGGAGGLGVGLVAGAALDAALAKIDERRNREAFLADNRAAVRAIMTEWRRAYGKALDEAVDVWFDDARATAARLGDDRFAVEVASLAVD